MLVQLSAILIAVMFCMIAMPVNSAEIDKLIVPACCYLDPAIQVTKSAELQVLLNQDQADREGFNTKHFSPNKNIMLRDRERRKRAASLYAEGCLKSSADYYAAAMIFQHGEVPDHYYQAYHWAKMAAEKGNQDGMKLAAMAYDRYLVSIGEKQLFATQYSMYDMKKQCYCMDPVDVRYTDASRKKYSLQTIKEKYRQLKQLNAGKQCAPETYCRIKLKDVSHKHLTEF